jgi:hypothetical protein
MVTDTFTATQPATGTTTTNDVWTSVITDDGHGNVTVERTWEADAGIAPCTESFTLSSDRRSLTAAAGNTCPTTTPTLTNTLGPVTATLSSSRTSYTTMATYTLSETVNGAPYDGTGMAIGVCTKK